MDTRWRRLSFAVLMAAGFAEGPRGGASAAPEQSPLHSADPVTCAALTADAPAVTGQPGVKSATSRIVAAAGGNLAFCQVDILYGTTADQRINIRVGLPLNSKDGGQGGVEGAWNGRTEGIGGGGCSGSLNVNGPVNAGYVGSGSDAGHTGGDCEPGVKPDGTYNLQFINDFIRNGMKQQILLVKGGGRRSITARSPPTTIGTAARPADARATCSPRNFPTSSTASSAMRRPSTGRDSRPRRCGARS